MDYCKVCALDNSHDHESLPYHIDPHDFVPGGEPHCGFCGRPEGACTGGGFDDDTPAHDFRPGGLNRDAIEDLAMLGE